MTLPAKIIAQKNVLDTKFPWLNLIELQFNDAEDRAKRFVRNYEDLYWLSEKYWDSGCVAHWKMNDNAADKIVEDSSDNALNGTSQRNTDLMHVTGKVNGGLDFLGTIADYAKVINNALLNSEAISLACWVNQTTVTTGVYTELITRPPGGIWGTTERPWRLSIASDQTIYSYVRGINGYCNVTWGVSTTLGEWMHLIMTYNSTDGMKCYLNGVLVKSGATKGIINVSDATDMYIGYKLDGALDDIRIYNRALTSDEIKLLYNAGNGTEKVPVKYDSFNFSCSLIQENSEGELPKTTLAVSNVTQFLQEFLEETEGLVDSTILFTIIHADNLGEDYAELQTMFEVLASRVTAMDVIFEVGGMSLLRQRFPLHRYFADLCRHRFENARCQYSRKTVIGVTLSGTDPVSVQVTAHTFSTGDGIRLAGIAGITPSLDGTYIITKIDANNFTLNGTNSSNYAGTYTNGGTAGYSVCGRRLFDCRQRTNSARFGAFPGIESGTVRIA